MDLAEMLAILWRSKWMILVTAIVTAGLVAFASYRQTPVYRADAVLVVGTFGTAASNTRLTEDALAASYADLMQTPDVAKRSVDRAGMDIDPARFNADVQPSTIKGSPYIRLHSANSDPQLAIDEVNAAANGLVAEVTDIKNNIAVEDRQKVLQQLTDLENEQNALRAKPAPDQGRIKALDEARQAIITLLEDINDSTLSGSQVRIVGLADGTSVDVTHTFRNISIAFMVGAFTGVALGFLVYSIRRALVANGGRLDESD